MSVGEAHEDSAQALARERASARWRKCYERRKARLAAGIMPVPRAEPLPPRPDRGLARMLDAVDLLLAALECRGHYTDMHQIMMTERPPLTERQLEVLRRIASEIRATGYSPTFSQLARELGGCRPNNIRAIVQTLEAKGYLQRRYGLPRMIRLIDCDHLVAP